MKKLLVLLIFLGLCFYFLKPAPPQVFSGISFVDVRRGSIQDVVTSQGRLEPRQQVDVGTQVSGQIKKLHPELGQMVKQGDLLAEIDPRLYEARVLGDSARLKMLLAQKKEREAELVVARQKRKRNQQMLDEKVISKETWEEIEADFTASEARIEALDAQIEEARSTLKGNQTNLDYTKVFAPMNGTVVQLNARMGQTLNANQTAPLILQIADLQTMTVRAQVAEADVTRLKEGMDVEFSTLGHGDRRFKGQIRQIHPSAETIGDVVLYPVLIDVENPEGMLKNGMSAQVFFNVASAKDVLLIPSDALGKRVPEADSGQGKAYMVRVLQGEKALEKTVLLGLISRQDTEVISGLQESDKIIVRRKADSNQKPNPGRRMGGFMGGHL